MSWILIRNSLLVAGFTTALSVTFGFLFALWLAGLPKAWRNAFFAAAILALALPPFLVTNSWLHFFGHVGVWRAWLPINMFSLSGTVWVLSMLLWPLTTLLVWGSWGRLEPEQLENDMRVRGRILIRALLLPLSFQAIVLSALLTLVLALDNFAVPAILQVKVLPAEMWIRFNTEFDTLGALRGGCPLVVAPLFLVLWLRKRTFVWPSRQGSVSASLFRRQLGPVLFCAGGFCACALIMCAVVLPLVQILSAARTWNELPGALAAGHDAVQNSLLYATAAATVASSFALFGATFRRTPHRPTQSIAHGTNRGLAAAGSAFLAVLGLTGWLMFFLPGVLVGIGLIHLLNHGWSSIFYQSIGIVILALVLRYFMICWQGVSHAVRRADPDLLAVALLERASRWQAFRWAIWPQIARPALVTWYLIFLFCLWDVESILLVVPPGGETLALRIFNLLHYGHNAQVNALCLVLLLVALVPWITFLAARWAWRLCRWLGSPSSLTMQRYATFTFINVSIALVTGLVTSCTPRSERSALSSQFFDHVQFFGSRGVGVGQLNKPRSIAVDLWDNLYVVDMTGRVQKFSSNGVFLLSWQMPQTDRGKPKGMGHDQQGNIFVVEPHYSRVNIFSPTGNLLTQWGSHGTNIGQLSLPRAVAVTSRGDIFVSEYQEIERVQKFAFAPGATLAGAVPRCLGEFGHAGVEPGEFNRPEGLCVDEQDRLYVADSCNHRIQIFSSDGKFLRAHGKAGQGPGEMSYPYDICVDREGRQYVCEFGNSRIQVFDAEDKPIEIIGGPGTGPGQFNNPWGLALDSAENLYVADSQNHRVQKLLRKK